MPMCKQSAATAEGFDLDAFNTLRPFASFLPGIAG
jgi:hypothetical protein